MELWIYVYLFSYHVTYYATDMEIYLGIPIMIVG
jgi:hypothetical protein